jgi:Ubiquitin-like modifier-activating enzyme ATG7 N-terminus
MGNQTSTARKQESPVPAVKAPEPEPILVSVASASVTMTAVQFTPLQSQVSPQLWHQLSKLKIDVLRLSEDYVPIAATYAPGRTVVDRESGKEIGLGCTFNVSGEGLTKEIFQ